MCHASKQASLPFSSPFFNQLIDSQTHLQIVGINRRSFKNFGSKSQKKNFIKKSDSFEYKILFNRRELEFHSGAVKQTHRAYRVKSDLSLSLSPLHFPLRKSKSRESVQVHTLYRPGQRFTVTFPVRSVISLVGRAQRRYQRSSTGARSSPSPEFPDLKSELPRVVSRVREDS